jgi:hypothetical protein
VRSFTPPPRAARPGTLKRYPFRQNRLNGSLALSCFVAGPLQAGSCQDTVRPATD